MEQYVYLRTIAEGSYGDVHACLRKDTGELCAVKRMKDAHIDGTSKRLALREAQIHRALLPHVNVTRLMDAFRGTSGRVYLVFDLANRSLLHEMRKHPGGVLPSDMAKVVAWQLLRALEHCHKQGVVHRDVKPANVLIGQPQADPAGRRPPSPAEAAGAAAAVHPGGQSCSSTPHGAGMVVKLCDFGLARYLPSKRSTTAAARPRRGGEAGPLDDREQRLGGLTDYVVTRWYRAPEVIISCEPYDTAVDIWSFGCTLAELMSGTPLFPGSSSPDQLWRIMRCCGALADRHAAYLKLYPRLAALAETPAPGRTLAERVPAACPHMLDLINACLNMDPLKRPTATQLLQHPFFADVPRLLAADPELQQLLAAPQTKVPQPLMSSSAPVPPNDKQQPTSQQPPGVPVVDVTASTVAAPAPEPATPAAAPAVRAADDELAAAAAAPPAETVRISSGNSCSSICIIEVGNMAAADTEAPRRVLSLSALVTTAATVAADAAEAVASASSGGCGVGCGETSATVDTAGGASGTSSCMAMAWPHLLAARGAVTQPPHVIPVDLRVSYLDLDAAMPAAAAGRAYQQRLRDVGSEQLRPVAVEQGQRRHMSYPRLLPNALQQVYASASEAQQQDAVTVDAPATADTAAGGGGERCHGGYTRRHGVLSDAKSAPVSNQASTKASPAAAVAAAGSRAVALSPAPLLPTSRTLGVVGAASASPQCSWSHLRQSATPAGPPYCAAARQVDMRFPIGRGPRAPPAGGCAQLRPPTPTGRRTTVITPLAVEAVDVYEEAAAAAAISLQTSGDELPSQVGAVGSRSLQDGGGSTWPFACSPAALYSSRNSAATAPGDAGDLYRVSSIGQGPTGAGALSHRGPRRLSAADLDSGGGVVQRSTRNSEATVLDEPALPCNGSGDGDPAVQQHPTNHLARQRPTLHAFVSAVQLSAADGDVDSDEPPEAAGVATAGACCGGNDHAAAPLVAAAVSFMAAAGAVTETVPLPGGDRGFCGGAPQRPDSAAKTMDTHDGSIEVTVSVRLAAAILTAAVSAASTFSRGLTTGVSSAPLLAAGSSGGAAAVAAPEAAACPSAAPATAAVAAAGQAHACSSATVTAAPEQQAHTAARILLPPPAAAEDVYGYAYGPAADLLASVGATAACHGRLLDLELQSPFDLAEDTTTPRPPEPLHAALVVSNAVSVTSTTRTTRAVTPVGSGCSGSILVASGYGGGGPVAGIIDINALFTTVGGNQQTSNTCCTSVYSCATSAYVQGGGNGSATPCSSTAAAAAGPAGRFAAHSFSMVSAAAGAAVGSSTTAFGTAGAAAGRCGGHRGVMTFLGSSHQGAEMELLSGSAGVPLAPGASNPLANGAANRVAAGGAATAVSAAALQLRNSAIGSSTAPADVDATSAAGAAAAEATSASEACSATASVGVRLEASTIVRSRVLERLLAQASSRLSCADKADNAGAANDSCARRDRRRSGSRDYSLSGSVSGLWWKGFAPRPASLDVPEAQVLFAQQRQEQQSHDVQTAASRAAAGVSNDLNWNDVQAGRGQATRQLEAEGRAAASGRTAAVCTAENAAVAEAAKPSRWRTWLPSSCWRV